MSVKQRVVEFTKATRITVSSFEKSIDVSNGYVNSISKSIGIDKIELILEKYPNLNIEWLLTGKGEMLRAEATPLVEHKTVAQAQPVYQAQTAQSVAPCPNCGSLQQLLEAKNEIIKGKDEMIGTLNQFLASRNEVIASLNETIASKEALLEEYKEELFLFKKTH